MSSTGLQGFPLSTSVSLRFYMLRKPCVQHGSTGFPLIYKCFPQVLHAEEALCPALVYRVYPNLQLFPLGSTCCGSPVSITGLQGFP